jgi:hypothetical protein
MTLASTIIERAFRKLGVKAEDEGLTADQLAYGLDTFNAMMNGFELFGIALAWVDKAEDEDIGLAVKFDEGLTYILAERLSPDYASPFNADDFLRRLQAAYMVINEAVLPSSILRTPSQRPYEV